MWLWTGWASLKQPSNWGTSRLEGVVWVLIFHCSVPDQVPSDMEVFEWGFAILGAKENVDFLKYFFHVSPEVKNLPDAWEWDYANLVQQPWWKIFHLTQNSYAIFSMTNVLHPCQCVWLIFACDSEQRCVGNLFYFFFPSEKWSESLSKVMVIWELGQPNEEVTPSYKNSSAHCTYLFSADISLASKYALVTSLWAWYCSESSFWLEDGGTALLGHRKNSCQVRCRARGGTCEHSLLPGEFGFINFSRAGNVGKEKANLFLLIKTKNDWCCYEEFVCISHLWK